MIVEWRPEAELDLAAAIDYIKTDNQFAAKQLLREVVLAADSLTMFPNRGRPGLAKGTRELVTVWPYILVYEIDSFSEKVLIPRLWHAAQDR